MSAKIIAASAWSVVAIGAGLLLFLLFSALMTGSDLRNRSEMAVFLGGSAAIVIALVIALAVVWMRALRGT